MARAAGQDDDLFGKLLHLEEQFIQDGKREGELIGEKTGFSEGCGMGEKVGLELGRELGFYYGCFLIWLEKQEDDRCSKADKAISTFGALLKDFPMEKNLSEDYMAKMLRIRAKFKVITSLLNIPSLQYSAQTSNSSADW